MSALSVAINRARFAHFVPQSVHKPVVVLVPKPVDPDELAFGPVICRAPRVNRPSIKEIQDAVCLHFDIGLTEMLSDRRTWAAVMPRQIAMWLCRKLTTHSLPAIAHHFGGRDHTTVMHAARKIEEKRQTDAELNITLMKLASALS